MREPLAALLMLALSAPSWGQGSVASPAPSPSRDGPRPDAISIIKDVAANYWPRSPPGGA
jgi:hypothetical protein